MSGRRALLLVLLVTALVPVAGCGGGGSTTTGTAAVGAVKSSQVTKKIGLVPIGGGRYRLGDCVATRVLTSPAAIERERKTDKQVVVAPTGNFAIVPADGSRCGKVLEEAVNFLNVP